MTMEMEIRTGATSLRAEGDGKLRGIAAPFEKRSVDLGGFVEVIQRGAFETSLKDNDIRALINHEGIAIARNTKGTLELEETREGLAFELELPDNQIGADMRVSVERGDVDQMSFGFRVREGGQVFSELENGTLLRTLTDVDLREISIVTFPAYPDSSVALRAVQEWRRSSASIAARVRMKDGLRRRSI